MATHLKSDPGPHREPEEDDSESPDPASRILLSGRFQQRLA